MKNKIQSHLGLTVSGKERRLVKHQQYKDRAQEDARMEHPGASENFLKKLHRILIETQANGLMNVISWQPHGRAFLIHDTKAFEQTVMKVYFKKQKDYRSFLRQLNIYDFKRITQGSDKGAYYHEYFLRGRPDLTVNILPSEINGIRIRPASNPDHEPNFLALPGMPLLVTLYCIY